MHRWPKPRRIIQRPASHNPLIGRWLATEFWSPANTYSAVWTHPTGLWPPACGDTAWRSLKLFACQTKSHGCNNDADRECADSCTLAVGAVARIYSNRSLSDLIT